MNITELRYLVAIMECGSVSAAAKRLYAAQPNVSKALKNLEEEYHLRIFERSSTGMIPTEQGRHFIEQAERVLREVDRLDRSVQEEQERCAELRVMIPHKQNEDNILNCFDKAIHGSLPIKMRITFSQRKVEFLEDFGSDVNK